MAITTLTSGLRFQTTSEIRLLKTDIQGVISDLSISGNVLSWTQSNGLGGSTQESLTLPAGGSGIVGEYVKELRPIVNGITVIRGDDSSYNVMVDESDLLKNLAASATAGIYEINVDQSGFATLVRAASDSGGVTTQEVTSLIGNNVATWAIASNTDLIPADKLPASMEGLTADEQTKLDQITLINTFDANSIGSRDSSKDITQLSGARFLGIIQVGNSNVYALISDFLLGGFSGLAHYTVDSEGTLTRNTDNDIESNQNWSFGVGLSKNKIVFAGTSGGNFQGLAAYTLNENKSLSRDTSKDFSFGRDSGLGGFVFTDTKLYGITNTSFRSWNLNEDGTIGTASASLTVENKDWREAVKIGNKVYVYNNTDEQIESFDVNSSGNIVGKTSGFTPFNPAGSGHIRNIGATNHNFFYTTGTNFEAYSLIGAEVLSEARLSGLVTFADNSITTNKYRNESVTEEKLSSSVQSKLNREIPEEDTAAEIKTKLETLTGDDRLDASAVKNLPDAQDVPLGFAYPVVEDLGGNNQGYAVGNVLIDFSSSQSTILSNDLNLMWRGVKVNAIFSGSGNDRIYVFLDSVPADITNLPSDWSTVGGGQFTFNSERAGGVLQTISLSSPKLTIGESLEDLINELGITAGYPDAGGLTTEEETKLNNSLRDLDLDTDGVLKVFDNNSTTNTQSDIDEEFNLPTIFERFFATKSQVADLIARLSQATLDWLTTAMSSIRFIHSETSRVVEDTTFGTNYFDYRSDSEQYLADGVSFDDTDDEISGMLASRSKLISLKKGSSFGNHLGVKNASDLDVGIVRTDSNNVLQVNSTGLRASSWVNVNSGLATSITVNSGDTLLIEVNPHPTDSSMIRIEIDVLRGDGTVLELNANDIPHNNFNWDTLILRDFTEIKGCDLNNYVGHDARRALLENHAEDKWVFGKAAQVTSTTDDVEVVGDLNVTGNLKIKGEAVDPSAGGGGTDLTGSGYLHLGVANIEGGDTGLVAGTTGHAEADGDRMERPLRFAVASTNVTPTGGSYNSATGNITLPEGHWLVCASVVVANNGTNKTDQNSRVRVILGIKYGDNIRHEQSDYSRWPNGATSRYSSAVDSDFSECKVSVAGGVISDGTTALTINLVTALQGQNAGATDEACNILSAHVHAYKQIV